MLNGGTIIYIGFTGNRMHVFWSMPSLSSVVLLSSLQNRIVCCIQPTPESQLKKYDWETAEEYPNWSHLWKQTKSKLESLRSLVDIDRPTETPCLQDISPQILYRNEKAIRDWWDRQELYFCDGEIYGEFTVALTTLEEAMLNNICQDYSRAQRFSHFFFFFCPRAGKVNVELLRVGRL